MPTIKTMEIKKTNLVNRRALFWDINEKSIEKALVESDSWVIERVFEYGEIPDIQDVIELYGEKRTKEVLSEACLQPMAKVMAFHFFNIDKNNEFAR